MGGESVIQRFYNEHGEFVAALVPAALWARCEPLFAGAPAEPQADQALDDFKRFMESWDYRYPYDPAVKCPLCGAEAGDWREGGPFQLKTASLGGTLIFKCSGCGADVRHKYFRYNFEIEADPPRRASRD